MHVKGRLGSEGARTSLTADIDGQIFKSWLVDQEGMIHLFTKVRCVISDFTPLQLYYSLIVVVVVVV